MDAMVWMLWMKKGRDVCPCDGVYVCNRMIPERKAVIRCCPRSQKHTIRLLETTKTLTDKTLTQAITPTDLITVALPGQPLSALTTSSFASENRSSSIGLASGLACWSADVHTLLVLSTSRDCRSFHTDEMHTRQPTCITPNT